MAENETIASFFEFESISSGVKEINHWIGKAEAENDVPSIELVDAFTLANGKYFTFLESGSDLSELLAANQPSVNSHSSKQVSTLKDALYHLNFISAENCLYTSESTSLIKLIKSIEEGWAAGLKLVELRKPIAGQGYVVMTGNKEVSLDHLAGSGELCQTLKDHFR